MSTRQVVSWVAGWYPFSGVREGLSDAQDVIRAAPWAAGGEQNAKKCRVQKSRPFFAQWDGPNPKNRSDQEDMVHPVVVGH